jgi:hypothetical protein
MNTSNKLPEFYRTLALKYKLLGAREKRRLLILSLLRLGVFAGGTGLTILLFSYGPAAGISSAVLTVTLFLLLLSRYALHSENREFFLNLETININEINALSGDLTPFNDGSHMIDPGHDFSNDVDLFGPDSLFHFLNRTVTGQGRDTLAHWLSEPYNLSGSIYTRQEAIRELADKSDWRQEFMANGIGKPLDKDKIESLLNWLNDKSVFYSSRLMKLLIWMLPGLTISSLILLIGGWIHYSIFTIFFLVNLLVVLSQVRSTTRIHDQVSKKYLFLSSLGRLLSSFENESFKASILSEIKEELSGKDFSAVMRIKKLSRIIQSFDNRHNILVGFVLNGLLLWDFHCIRALEKWKDESPGLFPEWLKKVGEIDAFISLANFAFNNPGYAYPEPVEIKPVFQALDLGHPLISSDKRVCNDFSIDEGEKIIIVTGANMAGKSTFLRTVAINFILAMSGAPVCALELKFTPLKLFTSMRTTDSLSHNESYFYAELKRLKALKTRLQGGEEIFFILDEILKGTNSLDKSRGSGLFMKKLVELKGTGIIATHDIALGELESEYPGIIFNKCFEIEIDGEMISFDYRLKDGITRKMNAALLMKQMGIA